MNRYSAPAGRSLVRRIGVLLGVSACAVLLVSCAGERRAPSAPALSPAQGRALIDRALPRNVADRAGWVTDLYAGFAAQALQPTQENVCAVVAVIEQESGFHVNPVVPGLGAIAWREIDTRAGRAGVPPLVVHAALQLKSSTGRSYGERIDAARTEKELSDIFEDFIGTVPLGRKLFSGWNPVRTRGPMQVNVAFVEQSAAARSYPYPVKGSLEDELFTRRGSVYFGIAHLLGYPAPYDRYVYRFADFNAGQYASRNAAFQSAVSTASGIPLTPDGALLSHDGSANGPSSTELAVRTLAGRLNLSEGAIHSALEQARTKDFEQTPLYEGVFALAEQAEQGRPLPAAIMPRIKLHGPKLSRSLTTQWYAHRVDERFKRCLGK
ncbi:MAG: lipoprotein [Gammaproteobacteria bacterium]|nr:lipoprotein [Gammaproteobacteria bacterium]